MSVGQSKQCFSHFVRVVFKLPTAALSVFHSLQLQPITVSHTSGTLALGGAEESVVMVSSGIASFCTFEDKSEARRFDEVMKTALQAESHFCGLGSGGHARSCEIGFDVPKGTSVDDDCAAMRVEAAASAAAAGGGGLGDGLGDVFRGRYEQIGRHQDS